MEHIRTWYLHFALLLEKLPLVWQSLGVSQVHGHQEEGWGPERTDQCVC